MKSLIKWLDRINSVLQKLAFAVAIVLMAAMLAAITWGVFVRLFLNGGFVWTDEFSRWAMVAAAFIGGAVLVRTEGLVSLDFIIVNLKGKTRVVIDLLVWILCAVFLVVFLSEGYEGCITYWNYKALTMPTNQAIPLIAMEFGGIVMMFFVVEKIIRKIYILCGGDLDEALGRKKEEGGDAA